MKKCSYCKKNIKVGDDYLKYKSRDSVDYYCSEDCLDLENKNKGVRESDFPKGE